MTAREIADIFVNIELRLIASLKRNLKRHKAEEKGYGFNWPAWQSEKMRNIEQFRRQNQAIISEYAPVIDADVEDLIQEEYDQGVEAETDPDVQNFFGVDRRRVDSLIEDVNNNLHEAESSSLRMMDDVYRQTIYKAEMAASTGSVTMEQAVDLAVKDFLAAGINCIQYRDGRLVNIATYAEMAIRTSGLRSYLRGAADQRAALGIDTVLVSQYGACSDTCLPWQGRVYIDDVWGSFDGEITGARGKSRNGKWYPLLSVAVEAGLFHPNCRHTLSTWIEGVSQIPKPLDAKKVRETAALEKKQRRMEAKIRRLKRLAEGTLDPDKAKEYRRKARAAQAELRDYIADNGDQLRRDYWREKTHGIPVDARSIAKSAEYAILRSVNTEPLPISNSAIQRVPLVKTRVLDENGNKALRKAHRDLLRGLQDAEPGTESIAYYDMAMRPIAAYRGGMWRVSGSKVSHPHVSIHNHPSGHTFSPDDIKAFIEAPEEIVLSVVGNGGQVYTIERLEDFDAVGLYRRLDDMARSDPEYNSTPERLVAFMEEFLKGVGNHGFRYTRRP